MKNVTKGGFNINQFYFYFIIYKRSLQLVVTHLAKHA